MSALILLRGNSGSGKSSAAKILQKRIWQEYAADFAGYGPAGNAVGPGRRGHGGAAPAD